MMLVKISKKKFSNSVFSKNNLQNQPYKYTINITTTTTTINNIIINVVVIPSFFV